MTKENIRRLDKILEQFRTQREIAARERNEAMDADARFSQQFQNFRSTVLQPALAALSRRTSEVGYRLSIFAEPVTVSRGPLPNPSVCVDAYPHVPVDTGPTLDEPTVSTVASLIFEADIPTKQGRVRSQFGRSDADTTHDIHSVDRFTAEFLDELIIKFIEQFLQREITSESNA